MQRLPPVTVHVTSYFGSKIGVRDTNLGILKEIFNDNECTISTGMTARLFVFSSQYSSASLLRVRIGRI